MNLKKGMLIKFVGFGWCPEANQAGMCGDKCKVLKSAKQQELDWPDAKNMWLVASPAGRGYWIHSRQAQSEEDTAK